MLNAVQTEDGERYVWCTFSEDQVDLNFANPQVLNEFVGIIRYYLERGVTYFRMDAVAFLWKEVGTPSIHLQQTHELIKILRLLIEHHTPDAVVITEVLGQHPGGDVVADRAALHLPYGAGRHHSRHPAGICRAQRRRLYGAY